MRARASLTPAIATIVRRAAIMAMRRGRRDSIGMTVPHAAVTAKSVRSSRAKIVAVAKSAPTRRAATVRTSTAMTRRRAWRWSALPTGIAGRVRAAVVEAAGVEAEAEVAADVGTTDEVEGMAATVVAAGASTMQKSYRSRSESCGFLVRGISPEYLRQILSLR